MSEKSKKNQIIQYYNQNVVDFVENTRDVDFHVIQDWSERVRCCCTYPMGVTGRSAVQD